MSKCEDRYWYLKGIVLSCQLWYCTHWALYYYCDMMLWRDFSKGERTFHQKLLAALPLIERIASDAGRSSNTGPCYGDVCIHHQFYFALQNHKLNIWRHSYPIPIPLIFQVHVFYWRKWSDKACPLHNMKRLLQAFRTLNWDNFR